MHPHQQMTKALQIIFLSLTTTQILTAQLNCAMEQALNAPLTLLRKITSAMRTALTVS